MELRQIIADCPSKVRARVPFRSLATAEAPFDLNRATEEDPRARSSLLPTLAAVHPAVGWLADALLPVLARRPLTSQHLRRQLRMDTTVQGAGGRVLLPFPGMQGHANPMLQLGRRLAYHGLRPTLVLTRHVLSTTTTTTQCPFPVAAISDGFDAGGIASCADTAEYMRRMEAAGSDTLARLLLADDVLVLVYDSPLPWARHVSRGAGMAVAAFFTQMCAVDVVYGEVSAGRAALWLADGSALRERLSVELGPDDVPPFVAAPAWYHAFTESALSQFDGLDQTDHVLVNSFRDLEPMD